MVLELELVLLLGVLLAPELGVEELVAPEDAPLLGVVLGEVLGEVDELEPELGVLGVLMLPEAEPLAEPDFLVVSLVDDPDEDVAPEGEDGVVAPREVSPVPGPRSQP